MIAALRSLFSFPLLSKELMERAARPRTYWVRVGAAILLYGSFWVANKHILEQGAMSTSAVLGAGIQMFEATTVFLFGCIAAFVPAMLCGVITQEKERDSLVLLLLTRMRPWQIALQKYLGGLVPALTLLLLAMPLVAVAYAYGGVSSGQVAKALMVLVLATFQVGAIALWASCYFRTTVTAFLMTYFVGAAVFGIPGLVLEIEQEFDLKLITKEDDWLFTAHFPLFVAAEALNNYQPFNVKQFVVGCSLISVTTLAFLSAAIWQLPRRAFERPKNRLRRIFGLIDRLLHRANKLVGSVTFGKNTDTLPGQHPVVWREKRARALARPEYVVRLLVLILIPVVLLSILFVAGIGARRGLSDMVGILAGLATVSLCATAANGIVNERVNQTFEVLLTTPMPAAEILKQKVRALRPFVIMLLVPILFVSMLRFVLQNGWLGFGEEPAAYSKWIYPFCILITAAIYFPLFTWFSVWMGMWCKTRIRAIVMTLVLLVVWFVGPVALAEEFDLEHRFDGELEYVYLLSPLTMPILNEFNGLDELDAVAPWKPALFNYAFYGGIFFLIRRHCLRHADWYLRR
jgi:hypothetical protein